MTYRKSFLLINSEDSNFPSHRKFNILFEYSINKIFGINDTVPLFDQ